MEIRMRNRIAMENSDCFAHGMSNRLDDQSSESDLMTLAQWFSPSFPIGSFAYSQGLEWSVSIGDVDSSDAMFDWLCDVVQFGSGRNDAIFLCHARNATDRESLLRIAGLAEAFCGSRARWVESMEQGEAFVRIVNVLTDQQLPRMPYPVAIGAASRRLKIPDRTVAAFYLQSIANALVSAAVRLVPLGQTAGQSLVHAVFGLIEQTAAEVSTIPLDGLGGPAFRADMAMARQESMSPRLFRT